MSYTIIILIVLIPFSNYAQDKTFSEYDVKAEFIERFTRFIDWPSEAKDKDKNKPFVIGVVGKNKFISFLKMKYSSQKIKGRKVEFKEITGLDEIDNCYLIYICKGEGDFTKQILSYTSNKPILTISDDEELSSKGVLITLFVQNEHMFFQVNKSAVQQSGLYFSSLLLSLSKNINTEEN